MKIPPTRNHRQLAVWVNNQRLVDTLGRRVMAQVTRHRVSTDRKIPGTRLRRAGRGRTSLRFEIWLVGLLDRIANKCDAWGRNPARLFEHESGETYRRHSEAREWVEQNLKRNK